MESLDYWRLCDQLNVIQAALLVADGDPSSDASYVEKWTPENRPRGYEAAKTAISHALRRGAISGQFVPEYMTDINGNVCGEWEGSIDLEKSQVGVESLKAWLASRGMRSGFFFPTPIEPTEYFDPAHPRYAPKLAAAVHAWLSIGNEHKNTGKSPKQILMKWLRENAPKYGLVDDEGKPNETGIEEVAKVANWQPTGGAPKTPG